MTDDFTHEFRVIEDEFSKFRQAAGLSPLSGRTFDSPDDYRKAQVRMLQSVLPRTVPASIRADATTAPASVFIETEARVKMAVMQMASQSDTLRPMVTRDKSGREITEFIGAKRAWMREYTAVPLLMRKLGNAEY